MVFLVGARRSGTNWLQHLLTLHPALATVPGETHLFSHGIAAVAERVQHGLISSAKTGSVYVDRDTFVSATRTWCDAVFAPFLSRAAGASLLLERTPLHAQHLDLIASIYPDAHVVHLVRDGTAVARSLTAQEWGPTTLREAAREWATTVRGVAEAHVPLLLDVRHEQLAADPIGGVTAVWEWLGLPVDDGLAAAVARDASKPVNVTEGKPGAHRSRGRLSARDAANIVAEAGTELERLGYALPRPRPLRTGAAAAAGRLRAHAPRQAGPADSPRPAAGGALWYEYSQQAVDELMAALETDDAARLAAIATSDLQVQVDGATHHGDDARSALRAFMTAGEPRQQMRAEVHPANPTFTVFVWHRSANGAEQSRALVVTPDERLIRRVVCYRFDNASPTAAAN